MAKKLSEYVDAIRKSGKSIFDSIEIGDETLWIPDQELEEILLAGMKGLNTKLPPRTRSKLVKQRICEVLGYPVPKSFRKTKPRFVGQKFDTYVQVSDNLQIWNAAILPAQRYVILRASPDGEITHVRVIGGPALALLDKTGTLTRKYQASVTPGELSAQLIVPDDSDNMKPLLSVTEVQCAFRRPTEEPKSGQLIPIAELFRILLPLIGRTFSDPGHGQERIRGGMLHELVCKELGYLTFSDSGQLPDVLDQLLEVKLQLAPTIDLGLVSPDSKLALTDTSITGSHKIRHCDLRYAIFCGKSDGVRVTLTRFFLTTGEAFFTKFKRFEGQVINTKIQIPLPQKFFYNPKK